VKIAVSIPDEIFEAGEKASRRLRMSRSRFYAEAVRAYTKLHDRDEVTRRLNAVYSGHGSAVDSEWEAGSLDVLRAEKW